MEAEVAIDAERPRELKQVLEPSLNSDETVTYRLEATEEQLKVHVETEGLGALRGCTDTIFRLSSLARKQY